MTKIDNRLLHRPSNSQVSDQLSPSRKVRGHIGDTGDTGTLLQPGWVRLREDQSHWLMPQERAVCMASVTLITLIVWSWTCGAKMIQAFETFSEFYCMQSTHTQIMQSSLKTSRLLTKQPKDLFSIGTLEFQALVGHQSFGLLRTMHLHGFAMVRNRLEVVFCEFLETQIFHTLSTHGARMYICIT